MSDKRREDILDLLNKTRKPLTGNSLAQVFDVSRQIIVQDIAILRARGIDIVSTSRGYFINKNNTENISRVFIMNHDYDHIEDELSTILEYGATIKDVIVEHPVYGQLNANLMIENKNDLEEFINKMEKNKTEPLMKLTNNVHFHTVEAKSEKILDLIEKEFIEKGYLHKS